MLDAEFASQGFISIIRIGYRGQLQTYKDRTTAGFAVCIFGSVMLHWLHATCLLSTKQGKQKRFKEPTKHSMLYVLLFKIQICNLNGLLLEQSDSASVT